MSTTLAPHPAATPHTETWSPSLDQHSAISLPYELWVEICKHLSPTHLSRLLCCSRTMSALRFEPKLQPTLEAAKLLRQHGAHRVLYAALERADRDKQSVAVVRALLNEPMVVDTVNQVNAYGCNAFRDVLRKACRQGHDIVSLLLSVPGMNFTEDALHALCSVQGVHRNTQLTNLKRLLEMPVLDVNAESYVSRDTALHIACEVGYVEAVALLLAHPQIDMTPRDQDGCTPLFVACAAGHAECVQLLLQHCSITVGVFASNGCMDTTAREVALRHGHHAIDNLLAAAETRIHGQVAQL